MTNPQVNTVSFLITTQVIVGHLPSFLQAIPLDGGNNYMITCLNRYAKRILMACEKREGETYRVDFIK